MIKSRIRHPDRARRLAARRLGLWVLGCAILAASAAGCAKARAETVPDGPALATPAPPPRVLAPVEEILAEAPPPPETPPETIPAPAAESRPPQQRRPVPDDTQKPPEPAPAAPSPVVETPVRQPPANPAEEKKINDVIARATRDLGNVHYQGLNDNGRAQYEESKRFAELATGEVKNRNYVLAATLADKAATIASQLLRP
jgi:outer membrane biosynthesis protein TonB